MRCRCLFFVFFAGFFAHAYKLKGTYGEAYVDGVLGKYNLSQNTEVTFTRTHIVIGTRRYLGFKKNGQGKTYYISEKVLVPADKQSALSTPSKKVDPKPVKPSPKPEPKPAPKPTPKPDVAPSPPPSPAPSPQGSKYIPSKKEVKACLNSKDPVDVRSYYGNTCSEQEGGSCVGQASVRALDATKVRYRERHSVNNLDRMEILAEPFYLKAQQFALLGSANLSRADARAMIDRFNDTTNKGDSFTDGAYPNEFFPAFLRTLQRASMNATSADPDNIPVVRDSAATRAMFAEEIKVMNEKIRAAYQKWEAESGINLKKRTADENDLNKLLNYELPEKVVKNGKTTTEGVSLRKKIAAYITIAVDNFYERIRKEKPKDLGKITKTFAKDVFYKPLFEAGACDPAKLEKTVRYFLCNRIPLVGWGEMKSVGIGGSHAMTVVGVGNGKITFRNSWGQTLPFPEVPLTKLCSGELSGLSYLGARGDPGLKDIATLPQIYRGMAGELTSEEARTAQVNPIPH